MLTDSQFTQWHERLGLSIDTIDVIRRVRASQPSRRVGSKNHNVRGRYPSDKMGRTIQFESHSVELAAIRLMEFDADVVEYYDQPEPMQLKYLDKSGRRLGPIHTPDFFILRTRSAGWEEWKSEGHLQTLAESAPNRYVRDGVSWRCPPGEAVAAPLGLDYALRSDAEIDAVFVRNIAFLEDYVADDEPVSDVIAARLRRMVASTPGISVRELITLANREMRGT